MNMTEQKKPVWQVLAAKAEKEVRQAQLVLAEMHQRKEQAQARDEKLEQLLVEYAAQLHAVQRRARQPNQLLACREGGHAHRTIVRGALVAPQQRVEPPNLLSRQAVGRLSRPRR